VLYLFGYIYLWTEIRMYLQQSAIYTKEEAKWVTELVFDAGVEFTVTGIRNG
jgi:hypothetical protein